MRVCVDMSAFRRRTFSEMMSEKPMRESTFGAAKSGLFAMTLMKVLVVCLVALPLLVALRLAMLYRIVGSADARILDKVSQNGTSPSKGSEDIHFQSSDISSNDILLGGLLAPEFDEGSCLSRYQSSLYRRKSPHKPSSYLLSRLRNYENLHKRCGPNTESYNMTVNFLRAGKITSSTDSECKYVVWISHSGLGNRILTITSAFLYAILTNRVLLVDPGKDTADLFCEPFPEKSWLLPSNFPLKGNFRYFDQKSPDSLGNMLKNNNLNSSSAESLPPYLYLHLVHDYDDHDKFFLCGENQKILSKIPWLITRSDNYFVPGFFLSPSFQQELSRLFPNKGTVFHHLGRYLFHPSNQVWGHITRYYQAYLSNADERIGIQIRVWHPSTNQHQQVMDQVLACTRKQKLLPEVDKQETFVNPPSGKPNSKAVLVTSLSSWYFDKLRDMYWENPAVNGEVIRVYQPSHEEFQQINKRLHESKAWAEMYLLSMTDVLVISGWSTFGYVAQGLGGLKPWILYRPENNTAPDPPCVKAMSMEPCFHAPPFFDCRTKEGSDTGKTVPHVRHCEDVSWGLKIDDSSHDDI